MGRGTDRDKMIDEVLLYGIECVCTEYAYNMSGKLNLKFGLEVFFLEESHPSN